MTVFLEKLVDFYYFCFDKGKYNFRVAERKVRPYKIGYYKQVETELKKAMGDDIWPLYLHAQATDKNFIKSTCLLYEAGFLSCVPPKDLVPHLIHGLYVYNTESKPKGKIELLNAINIIKSSQNSN